MESVQYPPAWTAPRKLTQWVAHSYGHIRALWGQQAPCITWSSHSPHASAVKALALR